MDSLMIGLLGVVGLLVLLALGVHIGIALLISGFVGLTMLNGFQASMPTVVSGFYHKISNPALITLPLFEQHCNEIRLTSCIQPYCPPRH